MIEVSLIDYLGTDLTAVDAARVSFDKESDWGEDGELLPGDVKLINYLSSHGHFTPFTHPQITLRETVPIIVARQRFKHQIGFTYNEVSRRYVDTPPKFYTPETWRTRPTNKKQGSGDPLPFEAELSEDQLAFFTQEDANEMLEDLHSFALATYNSLIKNNVAPELARMVLPQSMLTSYYVTGSLAAYARAYNLRSKPDAQYEIQVLAKKWSDIMSYYYPVSWTALTGVPAYEEKVLF